jgi:hypothetical protein
MVWAIEYLPQYQVVIIKTHGDILYNELQGQFEEAVRMAQEADTDRFLFDDTDLHINVSTVDIYDIPKLLISAGVSRASRIAVVISPKDTGIENYRFLETVCQNQGFTVKVYTSLSRAYDWLTEQFSQ